jgi:hypothetical protein
MIQVPEYFPADRMLVIVCPTSYDSIQFGNDNIGSPGFIGIQIVSDFCFDTFNAGFGRLYQKFSFVFPDIEAKKIKAIINMRDHGFFF